MGGGEDALLMAQRSEGKKYAPTLFNYGGFYKIDIAHFAIQNVTDILSESRIQFDCTDFTGSP